MVSFEDELGFLVVEEGVRISRSSSSSEGFLVVVDIIVGEEVPLGGVHVAQGGQVVLSVTDDDRRASVVDPDEEDDAVLPTSVAVVDV